MTLMNRMTRLFKADVHGILDHFEDPAAVLKQAVREMEISVIDEERQLQMLEKRQQHLNSLRADSIQTHAELESQIQLTLESGNEELCRTFVRKRLEEENRLKEIDRALKRTTASKEELSVRLNQKREQLQAMIKKMELFVTPESSFGTDPEDRLGEGRLERRAQHVTDEDVEVAMLKLRQKGGK